jgi:hypothetical protein
LEETGIVGQRRQRIGWIEVSVLAGLVCRSIIPALGRLREADEEFEASLGYHSESLPQK